MKTFEMYAATLKGFQMELKLLHIAIICKCMIIWS